MGYVAPEFEDDEDAFNRLKLLLKHVAEPTLFILDNVWPGSDSLLDNFSFQLPDYKLLVTSISTFPRFDCTQKLEPLNFEDSMHLFCYSAGLQEGSSYVDEELVTKVVKACNGFPLALKVVGRSLYRQPPAIWRNRLKEWSKSGSLFETNKEILKCLKSSFDALDDTVVKDCYMDLGSFPEGQFISATALIDIWAELYKLEEDEMTSYLHKLSTLSLVDLAFKRKDGSEIEGYYEDHFVMQHDLLRGMVNHLSNLDPIEERKRLVVDLVDRKFPDWWCQLKQPSFNARLLSFYTDETFSSSWCNMQAPEVEVLILNFRAKKYTLPRFTEMENLKALIVTNYGVGNAEIINFELLSNLEKLRRIRMEQVLIPSITLNSGQLKSLQKLSLFMCTMGQDFSHDSIQISDRLPNLEEINIGYCSNLVVLPVGMCEAVKLKRLSITYCNRLSKLPKEIGKLVDLQLLRLRSCINLLGLPDTIWSFDKLNTLDIADCLSIRKLPDGIGDLRCLRKLYMNGCSKCELPKSVINLRELKHVVCDEETAKSWEPIKHRFSNLRIGE
ncbi:hypothetical protein K2173_021465 [Erythroxylum novogranatense]|uniref:Disease resistance R13L4/SHOC-2-like LRR domain-containing protein n=1 Tax=Erythroxylum novogranatense TaxID=1862640 RepID=A0AAV8TVE9_9ROSI|nr:hypothetical protein K2173_021465 [Erythroxylum novogranatense]